MNYYLLLAIICTAVVCTVGFYVIFLVRAAHTTLGKANEVLDTIRHSSEDIGKTAQEAEHSFQLLNERLPSILEDFGQTAASARSMCENTEMELRRGMEKDDHPSDQAITVAANLSHYVLKGYSVWKKIKRGRFPA